MHDDRQLIEGRVSRILRERIRPAVHGTAVPLEVRVWHAPGEPVPPGEAVAQEYTPASVGDAWGPPWGTSWFEFTGTVPAEWSDRTVEAVVDLGFTGDGPGFTAEGLVYRPDGTAVKGLHPRNHWVAIDDRVRDGDRVRFFVEAAANPVIAGPVTPLGDKATAGDAPLYRLARADLAVFDTPVWELLQDVEVLDELMRELPLDQPRRWEILRRLGEAMDVLDLTDVSGSAARVREVLAPALAAPAAASAHRLSAIGHAHIDSAWLWPLRETVRKVARTASNVVNLMDDHPEFKFAMSQAQQLAWIQEHRPDVFARVKEKIADGRFIPVGGMWVESDTNMPGSEAMARQFVHGKRYFLEQFGIETREVWLPDSFGYSAALPQLVALSGSTWFLTQKISWSATNPFPHHTFWWEGIDGTRVFTHFPPIDTYNAEFTGRQLAHAVANFRDKGAATRSLVPFGHGDGGGGPTREMLARAARLRNLEGSPRVEIEAPEEFFAAAHQENPEAPVWVGELYLELHRGTYTSQARTKQGNRRSEHLLREAELWAATAAVHTGYEYPYDALDRLWKTVLLHQFHDILPGSSIAWVHQEAARTYAAVAEELTGIVESAQRALAGEGDRTLVFNAAPHARSGIAAGAAGERVPAGEPVVVTDDAEGAWTIDNGLVRVVVDARGLVVSVVDLRDGREAVPPGEVVNLLQIHPDLPNYWDAWDVDSFYRNRVTDLVDVEAIGLDYVSHDKVTLGVERRFGASTVTQTITLSAGSDRVDFTTEVDWHETETILKAAFPLDVRAETSASEIQFGHLHRPTHTNTSWEAAKFEICAHRFVHVAEPGWGAAVVNDSNYGHDVTRTVRADGGTTTTVRLSLLRAPRFPDPVADQGVHRFGYGLVPGADIPAAVRHGHWINLPERRLRGAGPVAPLVTVDDARVVASAVKLSDDGAGDVVVRLYEAAGGRAETAVRLGVPVASAHVTDLLERPVEDGELEVTDDAVTLRLRPFQITTVRFRRA
ncbi:alpha-mannosidase [Stackebrandtia albiflava]|uniref:Alpha-mannosidase n=1 Tax=Stackebrandtia albiflava TaxID=406432 RepID=A0A562VBR9_9ACTN|nr:glycoside hydrolase family 38 C-terminal domain-containing protein [Stackebrandtia albiflava]TWJ15334.1 alpha-mannosidase [Stackebrandtia albiflava]